MSRHSKNNTAAPIFTYAERKKLKYGTISERVGADSLKKFECCCICLHAAQEPLACPKGNIYCKACIYEYLLNQKKEISQQLEGYEAQQQRLREEQQQKELERQLKELNDFEKAAHSVIPARATVFNKEKEVEKEPPNNNKKKVQADQGKINAFWVPGVSAAQTASPELLKKPSLETKCPFGYPLRVKQLIKLNFTPNKNEESATLETGLYQCPSCCKTLTNVLKSVTLRKCGHVLCDACFKTIKKDKACYVCGKKFKDKHIVPLQTGSSYAASSGEKLTPKVFTPTAWL